MNAFSKKLKLARMQLHLNQQQLSEMVGVSKRTIAAYETTDAKPRGVVARKLASAINLSTDYLLDDDVDDCVMPSSFFVPKKARLSLSSDDDCINDKLLDKVRAFFENDEIEQEEKRDFFEEVMESYMENKKAVKAFFIRDQN